MRTERARSRCRKELELLADSTVDVDSLRIEAVEQLRRAIGFDVWCAPLVDPDTLIPNRPVVSETLPVGPSLPRFVVQDQLGSEINSRAMIARSRHQVGVLSAATGGDLARCRRWREFAEPAGIGDELRAAAVDEHGCWGSFETYRASDDPPFDSDDARLMRDAARILAGRLRQASLSAPDHRGDVDPGRTGVLLIDDALQPQGFTQAARDWFAVLQDADKGEQTPIPVHVYCAVGRLLAAEAGDDPNRPPRVRVRTSDTHWAIVEAARMEGSQNAIAVSVRGAGAEDILALVARAHGLTPRERELVALVLEGLDTRRIAERMFISTYTVKDHLKAVFDKLGVRSRRELVTGVFGQTA